MADDGRNRMRCTACGHEWLLGSRPVSPHAASARRPTTPVPRSRPAAGGTRGQRAAGATAGSRPAAPPAPPRVPARLPTIDDLDDEAHTRLNRLKAEYRRRPRRMEPDVADHRRLYELAFSEAGLPHVEPQLLKGFALSPVLAPTGNTSAFTREWNRLGDRDAARHFREVVEYLLRGPETLTLEDRFAELMDPRSPHGMTGVRESVLTRVLCVAEPERWLPITVYAGAADDGKREIAERVLGLAMPAPDKQPRSVARLAGWSNDLLVDAVGPGFDDLDHVAAFLDWAREQP
jgi:hypothetical protein